MVEKILNIYKNKMRLHYINTDKFKMARFSMNFIFEKDARKTPLTKLMLAVAMRGSVNYPDITQINKSLDELYGATVSLRSLSVGDKCIFKISCKMLENKYRFSGDNTDILSQVLKILSDIIFNPLRDERGMLTEAYIKSEKKIAIDAINSQINDPRAYASKLCDRLMFDGTPYAISSSGDVELVDSFTAEEITENLQYFYDNCLIECYYIGSEEEDVVKEALTKGFDFTKCKAPNIHYCEKAFEATRSEVLIRETKLDVSQSRLEMGYRCGTVLSDADYYAMLVFNEIFGGSSVSKLFMNVREKKSLCYYCYSSYHSATGTIKVGCGIKNENKDDAIAEIKRQLMLVRNGEFTDNELVVAKNAIASQLRQIYDSSAAIEAFILRRMLGNMADNSDESIEKVYRVDRETVILAAKRVSLDTVFCLCGEDEEECENE